MWTPGCGTLDCCSLVLPVSLLLKRRRSARGHCAGVQRQRAPGRPGKPPRSAAEADADIWHVYSCHIPAISTWSVKDDLSALVSAHTWAAASSGKRPPVFGIIDYYIGPSAGPRFQQNWFSLRLSIQTGYAEQLKMAPATMRQMRVFRMAIRRYPLLLDSFLWMA